MEEFDIEKVRSQTRAAAFLIPLATLCMGLFLLPDVREMILGGIIGASSTAAIFYFESKS